MGQTIFMWPLVILVVGGNSSWVYEMLHSNKYSVGVHLITHHMHMSVYEWCELTV